MEQILKNIKLLEKKLADFDLRTSYDLATKIKYEIIGLAEKSTIPKFEEAFVGIYTAVPRGHNNTRVWDTSNRAINLILNNLKGIFFSDDDIEHMAFSIVGGWSAEPKTIIFIGDFKSQSAEIME